MHGNLLNKNKLKLFNTANSDLAARILILENNVYKITYYEIISGASGTLTVPTAATINANEFSGANCILSEIDINNKPTWVSPKTAGGTVVTATLNTGTGAWVKSGVTVSANVALIYSINIAAKDYSNLTNFYIIDETLIGDFSYVLNNTTTGTVTSSLLANAMSDETGSGSLVFNTTPTFVTNITTPLILGGSAVGSNISYQSTSGVGTTTAAAHTFTGGTNGGTTIATLYNNGNFSIGNYASPNNLRLVTIGQDTAYMSFGSLVGGTGNAAIYMNQATPDANNYTLYSSGLQTRLNASSDILIRIGNATRVNIDSTSHQYIAGNATTSAITAYSFTVGTNTGQTASTEITNFKVTGATKTWSTGNITTQRWNYFTANTAAFASASTITNSYGLYVEKATAGSNATITNNFSLGTDGDISIGVGATNTYVYMTQSAPTSTSYSLWSTNVSTYVNGAATATGFQVAGVDKLLIYGARVSGALAGFTFTHPNNTGQTASTEINGYLYNSYSRTWATGNITTQREQYIKTVTYAFAAASTITNAYGLYVEAATAGTNATITNNWALGLSGGIEATIGTGTFRVTNLSGSTTQSAIYMNNTTAIGTTNYVITSTNSTATFNGRTNMSLAAGGTSYLNLNPAANSVMWSFSNANKTGNTASTELNQFKVTGSSLTWDNGGGATTIATQRWNYFTANTAATSGVGSLTITNSYGAYFEAATASGVTITNNWALGTNGNIWIDSSSASIYLGNITPSSSNYALSYTAANEVSVNAPTTGRIRAGGTIAATWSATDFNVNGTGGLSIVNNANDSKIGFTRTSGNTHSIQLSTTDYYLYNNTAAAIRYGVTNAGNFYIGAKSALATTATDGFLYVPSCAGVPTGVPTAITGKIPIVCDSTNNKMYIYSGGAWVALN